jgi:hypothetical protein
MMSGIQTPIWPNEPDDAANNGPLMRKSTTMFGAHPIRPMIHNRMNRSLRTEKVVEMVSPMFRP